MQTKGYASSLYQLYKDSPVLKISRADKIVILSDFHMGNGSERDDFRKNGDLIYHMLKDHYLERGYSLVLNGDIEELHKFSLKKILMTWDRHFNVFADFQARKQLYKIIGNHDNLLCWKDDYLLKDRLLDSLTLDYHGNHMLIYHGHQASHATEKYNSFFGFLLRYLAKPLYISSASTAYDSRKKFKVEKKVYNFSSENKIVSIIGHTHRPLFESLSRIDMLRYKIELLVREYISASSERQHEIEREIQQFKKEIYVYAHQTKKWGLVSSLYNREIAIPCIFNSGCAIGKRGVTAIEIRDGRIYLVYWFNKSRARKYVRYYDHRPHQLKNTRYYRVILKGDHLDYVFSRIKLLAGDEVYRTEPETEPVSSELSLLSE